MIDLSEKLKRLEDSSKHSEGISDALLLHDISGLHGLYLDSFASGFDGKFIVVDGSPEKIGIGSIVNFKKFLIKHKKIAKRLVKNPKDLSLVSQEDQFGKKLRIEFLILNSTIQVIHTNVNLIVNYYLKKVKGLKPKETLIDNLNEYTHLFTIDEYEMFYYLNKARNLFAHSFGAAHTIIDGEISKDLIYVFENVSDCKNSLLLEIIMKHIYIDDLDENVFSPESAERLTKERGISSETLKHMKIFRAFLEKKNSERKL